MKRVTNRMRFSFYKTSTNPAKRSFRDYFILTFSVAFIVFASILVILANMSTSRVINHSLEDMASAILMQLRDDIDLAIVTNSEVFAKMPLESAYSVPDVVYVEVLNTKRERLFSTPFKGSNATIKTSEVVNKISFSESDQHSILYYEDDDYWYFTANVFFKNLRREAALTDRSSKITADTVDLLNMDTFNKDEHIGYVDIVFSKKRARDSLWRLSLQLSAVTILYVLITIIVLGFVASHFSRPLLTLSSKMNTAKSDLSLATPYREHTTVSELATIGEAYNTLLQSIAARDNRLKEHTRQLEDEVERRTEKLSILNEQNRALIRAMNQRLEDERKYIAREIHDELNATLVAAKLQAWRVQELLDNAARDDDLNELKRCANSTVEMIERVYEVARNIIRRLRPEVIDTLGLIGAIEDIVNTFNVLHPECHFELDPSGSFDALGDELNMAIYRIIQESLTNVVKHSNAAQVRIALVQQLEHISISVSDDGDGFDPERVGNGVGILSMRERAHVLGGTLSVKSGGTGTTVYAKIPVQ